MEVKNDLAPSEEQKRHIRKKCSDRQKGGIKR